MSAQPWRRLGLVAVATLALCGGCTRKSSPPAETPPASAPAPLPAPATPPTAPVPAPPSAPPAIDSKADPERDALLFAHWRVSHPEVDAFEEYLERQQLAAVVPTYQLLRSASMWKECKAEPFAVPPSGQWRHVKSLLSLLRELQDKRVLSRMEVVSAYRDPQLNRCAGGAPRSSHLEFAVDLAPLAASDGERLCSFWRAEGKTWGMGVSRYPSGRIHVDRAGFRTWGASHKRASSYCLGGASVD
jgi:hypothetical protein